MSVGADDLVALTGGEEKENELNESTLAGLEDLPAELLVEVFKHLEHFTDAHTVMLVCWSWYRAAHKAILMDPKPPLPPRQLPMHYEHQRFSPDFHSSRVYLVDRKTNVYYVHVSCQLLVSRVEKMKRVTALMGFDNYLRWELQWDLFDGQGLGTRYGLDAPEEEFISGILRPEEIGSRYNALSEADRNIVDELHRAIIEYGRGKQ